MKMIFSSQKKYFNYKSITAGFLSLYMLNNFKNRQAIKCIPEEDEESNMKDAPNMFDESDPELNLEDDDMMKAMADPSLTDEEKMMLRKQLKQQSIQPFPFSKLHAPFKTGVDDEKWNGLRGVLDWSPNQMNKMEYTLIVDNKKLLNNYKLSAMAIIPFSERSQNGAFLIGRKEGDQSLGLQCHLNLSDTSKVLLVSSHPKPDINQGHYVMEYSHELERLNTTVKVSNMETSLSAVASVYKNLFVGFEAVKHPKTPSFLYNYGFCLKPSPNNKFGIAMTYMSVYPAISIDFLYNITRDWTTYINFSKNWHPMAAMGGGGDAELKMTHVYTKRNEYESNIEVDISGLLHFYHTHYINKNIGIQFNLEFNPFAKYNKKNKKVFRSFGVGIKYSTTPIEEEITTMSIEETYDEYDFEKISQEAIK